ncbi:MAG: hypothetical protein P8163_22765, partial [Candidatus Thiodiazotropha sp.]
QRRRKTANELDGISDKPSDVLVVHYSCESFYDREDGRTPRVTSIAVRNYESGQTESYSIHKIAEQKGIEFTSIPEKYDELEKEMLSEFFSFMRQNQGLCWVHWNMRDINYGFAALEHRCRVLQGEPFVLPEGKKFDLARALVALYGVSYTGHPRLATLIEKNHIAHRDFLTGKEESDAFESQDYIKLHQSTLRKVHILANILGRAADGTLKTNAKWHERYGWHPNVLIELFREHWISGAISVVVVIGGLLRLFGVL